MKSASNNLDYCTRSACTHELSLQDMRIISGGHETVGHDAASTEYTGHNMGDYVNLFGESVAYVGGYFFSAGPELIVKAVAIIRFVK